ncbi:MAG TPA: carboxypeptidase-like regulatory domain-containing protein, partial [Longimicrobium sp.]|nr:carboxypeptidase-like regulatory domain-containing protein [Longimicrobium sp.]
LSLACAAPLSAQTVRGTVLEEGTDRPVPEAVVTLVNSQGLRAGRIVAGADGTFAFRITRPDGYQLRAERVGYRPVSSPYVTLAPGDSVVLELRMSTRSVVLAPLTVVAGGDVLRDRVIAEFEYRRGRGFGRFVGPEQIERIRPFYTTDVLQQVPFVTVTGGVRRSVLLSDRRGGQCTPTVFIDRTRYRIGEDFNLDQMVAGTRVLAVEVYPTPTGLPAEFSVLDNYRCGVIVIWTRVT